MSKHAPAAAVEEEDRTCARGRDGCLIFGRHDMCGTVLCHFCERPAFALVPVCREDAPDLRVVPCTCKPTLIRNNKTLWHQPDCVRCSGVFEAVP